MTTIVVAIESRLRDFMLSVAFEAELELLSLVGRADSGKSVILRSIAGVYTPDSGSIRIGARTVFSSGLGVNVPPAERFVGFVPQTHALFPHLSVADNIAFPLRKAAADQAVDTDRRVEELLDLLALAHVRKLLPDEVSQLDRQRVALGRALAIDPEVVLLDDPFSSLDLAARRQARAEVASLRKLLGIPFILATTELEEALDVADRAALLDRGQLLQLAPPRELVTRPSHRRVAEIVQSVNVLAGEVIREEGGLAEVRTSVGLLAVEGAVGVRGHVDLVIRPEHIQFIATDEPATGRRNALSGRISTDNLDRSLHTIVFVPDSAPRGTELHILVSDLVYQQLALAVGQQRAIYLPETSMHLMPRPPKLSVPIL